MLWRGDTFHFPGRVLCNDHFRGGCRLHLPRHLKHAYKHRDQKLQDALSRCFRGVLFFNQIRHKLSRAFVPCVLAFARLRWERPSINSFHEDANRTHGFHRSIGFDCAIGFEVRLQAEHLRLHTDVHRWQCLGWTTLSQILELRPWVQGLGKMCYKGHRKDHGFSGQPAKGLFNSGSFTKPRGLSICSMENSGLDLKRPNSELAELSQNFPGNVWRLVCKRSAFRMSHGLETSEAYFSMSSPHK